MKKFVTLLMLLYLFQLNMNAKVVYGTIISEATSKPIPYVHLFVISTNMGCITDQNGYFEIELPDIQKDKIIIEILASAYDNTPLKVDTSDPNITIKVIPSYPTKRIKGLIESKKRLLNKAIKSTRKKLAYGKAPIIGTYNGGIVSTHNNDSVYSEKARVAVYPSTLNSHLKRENILTKREDDTPLPIIRDNVLPQAHMPLLSGADFLFLHDPLSSPKEPILEGASPLSKGFLSRHEVVPYKLGNYANELCYYFLIRPKALLVLKYQDANAPEHIFSKGRDNDRMDVRLLHPHRLYQTPESGWLIISVKDHAILHFQYTFGQYRDMYKFVGEYRRYKNRLYPVFLYLGNKFYAEEDFVSTPVRHAPDNFTGISVMPIKLFTKNLRLDWMSEFGRKSYNKLQRNATYRNVMIIADGEKAKPKYSSVRDENELMGRFCQDLIIKDKKPYIRHRMFYLTGFGPETQPVSAKPIAEDYYPFHFYPLGQASANDFMLNTATGMADIVGNKVDIVDAPLSIVQLYSSGYYKTRTPTIRFISNTGFEEEITYPEKILFPIKSERLDASVWGFYLDIPTTMTNNADYVKWMSLYLP